MEQHAQARVSSGSCVFRRGQGVPGHGRQGDGGVRRRHAPRHARVQVQAPRADCGGHDQPLCCVALQRRVRPRAHAPGHSHDVARDDAHGDQHHPQARHRRPRGGRRRGGPGDRRRAPRRRQPHGVQPRRGLRSVQDAHHRRRSRQPDEAHRLQRRPYHQLLLHAHRPGQRRHPLGHGA